MEVNQIYDLVNKVAKESLGSEAMTVTDTGTLVSLGYKVLSSQTATENFINTLVARIGRTIISYRKYRNQFSALVMDNMQWGAIIQKIKVDMPEAVEDVAWNLVDGQSIDQWIVNKPKAKQKFFSKEAPYSFFITVQEEFLNRAFTSAAQMGAFVSAIYGEVQNKLELSIENNARLAVANFIASTADSQRINLLTTYNNRTGNTLNAQEALFDMQFLRFAIGEMNRYKRLMKFMSTQYNKEGETRFTPMDKMITMIHNDFVTAVETQSEPQAFHSENIKASAELIVPYWQAAQNPYKIMVKPEGADADVELDNIIGLFIDRDAAGCFREEKGTRTTPINARGRYSNTFWHENQVWFNDMSENGLVFLLA